MNAILAKQFAEDYCCTAAQVLDSDNHFTTYTPLSGRRRFNGADECPLKLAVINGKLLCTGRDDIVAAVREKYGKASGEWFMEAGPLVSLSAFLAKFGCRIAQMHPFYTASVKTEVDTRGYEIVRYDAGSINQFETDERFDEAFCFDEAAPDVFGAAAMKSGEILAMAGASQDSPYMWQIGINTVDGHEGKGLGTMLVAIVKNEALDRGFLPYYGTAVSHIASQRVALKAGFLPIWTELTTKPIPEEQ